LETNKLLHFLFPGKRAKVPSLLKVAFLYLIHPLQVVMVNFPSPPLKQPKVSIFCWTMQVARTEKKKKKKEKGKIKEKEHFPPKEFSCNLHAEGKAC